MDSDFCGCHECEGNAFDLYNNCPNCGGVYYMCEEKHCVNPLCDCTDLEHRHLIDPEACEW